MNQEINNNVCTAMSAEEMCKIFVENFPSLFKFFFQNCEIIYKFKNGIDFKSEDYPMLDNLDFSAAILRDYGDAAAKRIGRILVSVTD